MVIFLSCIFGLVTTSLFISNVASLLNLASNEKIAYGLIAKLELGRKVETNFTSIMRHMIQVAKFKKGFKGTRTDMIAGLKTKEIELEKILDKFKETRQEYEGFEQPLNEQEMDRNFEILTKELKEIKILIKAIITESQRRGVIVQKNIPSRGRSGSKRKESSGDQRENTSPFMPSDFKRKATIKENIGKAGPNNTEISGSKPIEKKTQITPEKKQGGRDDTPLWMKEHQSAVSEY